MEVKVSELLTEYGSDKANGHYYGGFYDLAFKLFDRNAPLNILEIGVQKGGSLCAWKDYFPNAKVTGIDIKDEVLKEYRRDTINYIISDIHDYKTDEMFDIVIDDGSHWLKDAIHTVAYFSKKLKKNGLLIIEDVQQPDVWVPAFLNILSSALEYNEGHVWECNCIDVREVNNQHDDFIFVAEKI